MLCGSLYIRPSKKCHTFLIGHNLWLKSSVLFQPRLGYPQSTSMRCVSGPVWGVRACTSFVVVSCPGVTRPGYLISALTHLLKREMTSETLFTDGEPALPGRQRCTDHVMSYLLALQANFCKKSEAENLGGQRVFSIWNHHNRPS